MQEMKLLTPQQRLQLMYLPNSSVYLYAGTVVKVKYWLLTENNGKQALYIVNDKKQVYYSQTASFNNEFMKIASVMNGEEFVIRFEAGVSESGKNFVAPRPVFETPTEKPTPTYHSDKPVTTTPTMTVGMEVAGEINAYNLPF